jgi:hypothetical protein
VRRIEEVTEERKEIDIKNARMYEEMEVPTMRDEEFKVK